MQLLKTFGAVLLDGKLWSIRGQIAEDPHSERFNAGYAL